ncbi:MAG: hypothetical protein ACKO2L_05080 [Planctomycetaceae bacterium]
MRLAVWDLVSGWLLISLLGLALFWMAGYAVAFSLGGVGLISAGWTLEHWQLAISGSRLWRSLLLSGALAVCSTTLGWLAALSMVTGSRRLRTDLRLQALWCLPLAIPPAVQGFLGGVVLSRGGLLSRLCWWLGLTDGVEDFPVLVQDRHGTGLLLTMTAASIPLLVLFLTRTWMAIRIDDYLTVACSLGASRTFALRHVAIPMLWRRSRFLLLLMLLWNFSAWELPLLLGQQSPRMLSVLIQQSSGQFVLEERPQAFVHAVVYLCLAGLAVWKLSGYAGLDRTDKLESGDG